MTVDELIAEIGSSPLSRGIPRIPKNPIGLLRIIPALAGNTKGFLSSRREDKDHPRSRGEYGFLGRWRRVRRGIIPALAGNTLFQGVMSPGFWDHPRSRGEYRMTALTLPVPWGSSPLSRGIPALLKSSAHFIRIIPALAGNTWVAAVT